LSCSGVINLKRESVYIWVKDVWPIDTRNLIFII